jgi:hypothetical protein
MNETDYQMMKNNQIYIDYLDRLKLIATSLFTWEGLDDIAGTGASRFLELILYENGRAMFTKDKELGYVVLKVLPDDKYNIYMLPTKVQGFSFEFNRDYDFDDIVYIMNNNLCKPTFETLRLIAYRLYEVETTIETNLIAQKTPVLIEGDTKTILTLKNVYMQYSGNIPFIFGSKKFDINNKLNVLRTDAPYLLDKLALHKHEVWDEMLTFLGINNANTDKKERLITDEVNSNNELINYYLNCFYKPRKMACDELNKKYGLNVKVTLNQDINKLLNLDNNVKIDLEDKEGVVNG